MILLIQPFQSMPYQNDVAPGFRTFLGDRRRKSFRISTRIQKSCFNCRRLARAGSLIFPLRYR